MGLISNPDSPFILPSQPMNVNNCYLYVTELVNKLSSNSGLNIPKAVFVMIYNAVQNQWVEDRVKMNELNKIRIDEIQQLVVDTPLNATKKTQYYESTLPADYYHYVRSYSLVNDCNLDNWLVKEADVNVLLSDEFWKPSLEWGETICTLGNNKIKVYYDDFTVKKVNLIYYRYPIEINMADGYTNTAGVLNTDVDPEFLGSSIIEILNLTAQTLAGVAGDAERYSVLTNKVQSHT